MASSKPNTYDTGTWSELGLGLLTELVPIDCQTIVRSKDIDNNYKKTLNMSFLRNKHKQLYLTAKETHFSISISYQKPLSNFTLNDTNMFDHTHAFVPDHFIRHYTVKNIFLLINAKNAKQRRTLENTG